MKKFSTKQVKNIKKFNSIAYLHDSDEDDDEDDRPSGNRLGYFVKTKVSQLIEIPIDEGVMSPSYYRNVAQRIRDADEDDIVRFIVNSPGGRLDGLMTLLSSMLKTDATTEAHIDCFADSASSFLAMHCDNIYVSPFASMLVHHVTYGIDRSKAADIHLHVTHFNTYSEQFFKDTYELFLTDEEIQKCLDGYQLYLNADQIAERLERKFSILKELSENEDCEGDYCKEVEEVEPEQTPKSTKSGSKKSK